MTIKKNTKLNNKELKLFFVLTLMSTCGLLGVDIHLSAMPKMMEYFATDKTHMQLSIPIFLLGIGFSQLVYGPSSDKYGRKPIVILGLTIAAVSNYLVLYTFSIDYFLLLRLIQGIGCGVCIGVGRTIAADVVQGEKYAIVTSYMSLFVSLSPLCSPAIGSYIQHWFNWQTNFIVLGGIITIVLFLYIFFCKETNFHKNHQACSPTILYKNYMEILLNPVFMGCVVLAGIGMSISMIYATTSSFIFQNYFHIAPIEYGWIVFITALGGILGKVISPYYIKKRGSRNLLLTGTLLLSFSGISIFVFIILGCVSIFTITASVFFAMLCAPFILPYAASKALSQFHKSRGSAGALYGFFQMLIAFLVSSIASLLTSNSILVVACFYTIIGIIGFLIFTAIKNKNTHK